MKFKTYYIANIAVLVALTVYYLIVIPTLPGTLPLQTDVDGNITSYGSKYVLLIFYFVALSMFIPYVVYDYISYKKDFTHSNKDEERVIMSAVFISTAYFAITIVEMFRKMENDVLDPNYILKGMFYGMAFSLLILGNYFPRVEFNRRIGIRFKWTLKNERVWDKTHRFAGVTCILGGLLMFVITFFETQYYWAFAMTIFMLSTIVMPAIYSYKIYHKLI